MAATHADVKEYPNSYLFIIDMPGLKSGGEDLDSWPRFWRTCPRGFVTMNKSKLMTSEYR
ncbi:hypothetical protein HYC85_023140 [Camellia sinensis]|uniref:SHSP domain-containing protein n=1 Tax=Camellia sinensis TaxID=4442 RepID=A0A7J7GG19_CAMSI|nr:hypothetical protein HYC85_023140 [Camellia sinensis]